MCTKIELPQAVPPPPHVTSGARVSAFTLTSGIIPHSICTCTPKTAFTLAEGVKDAFPLRKFKCAFTLAEVLITLGIIGVIAALTIPSFIVKYQKRVTALRLKQFYSQMNEAVKLSEIDNGSAKNWDTSSLETGWAWNASIFFDKYFAPYLKIVKTSENQKGDDCLWYCGYKHYYLANGVFFSVHTDNEMYIMIKTSPGPIIAGKNTFGFMYHPDRYQAKVMPYTWLSGYGMIMMDKPDARERLKILCQSSPTHCVGLIMYDDWEIKDDYPVKF